MSSQRTPLFNLNQLERGSDHVAKSLACTHSTIHHTHTAWGSGVICAGQAPTL